ncbi:MAG: hypothetical protein H6656_22750 [Ardenticatenaceae bacterium]|nr:hypothetical protein [Ardenticatenaceae bacterium]MCB9010154.1 hypothetical protein [Ardenticatenaceae bacterium]
MKQNKAVQVDPTLSRIQDELAVLKARQGELERSKMRMILLKQFQKFAVTHRTVPTGFNK